MIIGVASYKGGVGKTTTAVHLAQILQEESGAALLLDGDATRNATNWRARGSGFEFAVEPIEAAAMMEGYKHKVIDTGQKPEEKDLLALARYVDLMVIPSTPKEMDTDGLGQTIRALRTISRSDGSPVNFKVLFTRVRPHKEKAVLELRRNLRNGRVPMFEAFIPELEAFDYAVGKGLIVRDVENERAGQAWAAYAAVGKELLDEYR